MADRVPWLAWTVFIDFANGVARGYYGWDVGGSFITELWNDDVQPTGTINAAGIAYQQVAELANGATFAGIIISNTSGISNLGFSGIPFPQHKSGQTNTVINATLCWCGAAQCYWGQLWF